MNNIVPIILAGGKGTRLWPMSRAARPKQFLPLTGDKSLYQQTLQRLSDIGRYSSAIVVTNQDYRFLVAEQALECNSDLNAILLEPVARNTTAAIAAACFVAMNADKDAIVHIMPSDHVITVNDAYLNVLETAHQAAETGRLATFGISPTEPATGFGYIEAGEKESTGAHKVTRFTEKPNEATAVKMLAKGNYFWNSGMFLFSASVFLNECRIHAPEVYKAAKSSVELAAKDLDFVRLDKEAFSQSPDISVDYAIFEKTDLASVVPSPIIWSDLGSWEAVWNSGERDDADNFHRGAVTLNNTNSSLVISEKLHVVVNGLKDVAVIASEDAVYIGRLSDTQTIGTIVKELAANPDTTSLTEIHRTSYRPWGGYTNVHIGNRFQVKKLSLQKHHHRSEHWIVVGGTAEVQVNDDVKIVRENESVYIPQGAIHRLYNPGKILLELIEVQTGSYLGEDDIIRIEDDFGRA
ncbi:MAG: mannose-1-phosphate guanylyltransferase/mannose-6-phosphate isomerase [Hyphomicrobiales bacterium]|nr:MAG: mannose-1-phosphate guanylyltransferase/mannose-6-phosphate isomerase [Hyphomicrobiales bacterium]